MEAWSLHYYDQHGESNGLGIALANPPAYMQATHHPTGKELRYYSEGEQRYQQLEQVAKDLLSCVSRWAPRGVYLGFSAELEALGVSLDG